jgi:hypothetical protein
MPRNLTGCCWVGGKWRLHMPVAALLPKVVFSCALENNWEHCSVRCCRRSSCLLSWHACLQPPKFALPSPAQHSGSSTPTPGFSRGSWSASTTPTSYKQPLISQHGTGADSSSSGIPQYPPEAAAAGPCEQGGVVAALREGIKFGDTKIYEFNRAAASDNSRCGSKTRCSSRRSSGRSSDTGPLEMTRSKSLGELSVGSVSCQGTPAVAASGAAAAAVKQAPAGGTLAVMPQTRQQQQQQQHQQQQWVLVPQLPRMSGAVCPPAGAHSRSRSGSPVCAGGVKHSSSMAVSGSRHGAAAGALKAPAAAAAAGGKTYPCALKLQPGSKRVL